MEKFLLLPILLVLLAAGCTSLPTPPFVVTTNDQGPPEPQPYSTEVTDIFDEVRLFSVCSSSESCDSSLIQNTCLKCPGEKIVLSQGCLSPSQIVLGPQDRGVCVQSHTLGFGYNEFRTGQCIPQTAFCLVSVDGREIPTTDTANKGWYEIWKDLLIPSVLSQDYFSNHVVVESMDTEDIWFQLKYELHVGWAKAKGVDTFKIKRDDQSPSLTQQEIASLTPLDGGLQTSLKEFNVRLTPAEVAAKMQSCHPSIQWSPEMVEISRTKHLVANAYGTVNLQLNDCRRASLDLETGEFIYCEPAPCYVT